MKKSKPSVKKSSKKSAAAPVVAAPVAPAPKKKLTTTRRCVLSLIKLALTATPDDVGKLHAFAARLRHRADHLETNKEGSKEAALANLIRVAATADETTIPQVHAAAKANEHRLSTTYYSTHDYDAKYQDVLNEIG